MFWFIVILLSAAFVGMLVVPVLTPSEGKEEPKAQKAALLAVRLASIKRDAAAGLLGVEEAAEAEIEASRAALRGEKREVALLNAPRARFVAIAFAAAAPLAAVWIYFDIGAPHLLSAPSSTPVAEGSAAEIAAMPEADRQILIENMVAGLAARLEDNPDDIDGWRMLARSYAVLGRAEESAGAYRALLERVEGDSVDWRGFAGALVAQGPGKGRQAELSAAMVKLQALNPDDPMALYFLGAEAMNAGDDERARMLLSRLLGLLPPDAPIIPQIEEMIASVGTAGSKNQ